MDTEDPKTTQFRQVIEAFFADHPTKDDITETFSALSQAIKDLHGRLTTKLDESTQQLSTTNDTTAARAEEAHSRLDDAYEQIGSAHERIETIKLTPGPKGDRGDQGEKGEQGNPGRDGADGRDAEDLTETIEELRTEIAAKPNTPVRIGWGAHPLTIQGLGIAIDKNTRVINFTGTGLGSVTRSNDGVVTVNLSGGGSGTGTIVDQEVPTDSGDHANFTIAHTPLAGTFKLYRGGAKQASVGTTPDYTLTGTALVIAVALDTVNGEKLYADYAY
jgi:hypothetical protein